MTKFFFSLTMPAITYSEVCKPKWCDKLWKLKLLSVESAIVLRPTACLTASLNVNMELQELPMYVHSAAGIQSILLGHALQELYLFLHF